MYYYMGCRYKYMLIGPLHIWYLRFILEYFIITRLIIDKCFLKYPVSLVIFILLQFIVFDVWGYHTLDIPFDINYRYFLLGMCCYELVEKNKINIVYAIFVVVILFIPICLDTISTLFGYCNCYVS